MLNSNTARLFPGIFGLSLDSVYLVLLMFNILYLNFTPLCLTKLIADCFVRLRWCRFMFLFSTHKSYRFAYSLSTAR